MSDVDIANTAEAVFVLKLSPREASTLVWLARREHERRQKSAFYGDRGDSDLREALHAESALLSRLDDALAGSRR